MDMHDNAGQPDTSDTYLHWGRRETLQAMAAALLLPQAGRMKRSPLASSRARRLSARLPKLLLPALLLPVLLPALPPGAPWDRPMAVRGVGCT